MEPTYTIKRSAKRKKLTVTVERDRSVIVHAPETTSEETIRAIVESKWEWIYENTRHSQKYTELPHPPGKELVSGESALYLGRQYQIEIAPEGATEIRLEHRFLIPASFVGQRKVVLLDWYVNKAKEKILPRVESFACQLGVEYTNSKIVDKWLRARQLPVNRQ